MPPGVKLPVLTMQGGAATWPADAMITPSGAPAASPVVSNPAQAIFPTTSMKTFAGGKPIKTLKTVQMPSQEATIGPGAMSGTTMGPSKARSASSSTRAAGDPVCRQTDMEGLNGPCPNSTGPNVVSANVKVLSG